MYLRDTDFPTLEDVAGQIHDRRKTWSGSSTAVQVSLVEEAEPDSPDQGEEWAHTERRIGTIDLGGRTIPATPQGIQVLAQYYEVPYKFLERVPADEQQFILDHRIQRSEDTPLVLKYTDHGISEAYRGGRTRVSTDALVEGLLSVFPEDSQVIDWWNDPAEFRLDLVVPEGFDKGIGGDRKVGDITHGGVRCGQNRKQNLAPWVQPFMFRLACTNGVEIPDYGLRIDARGLDEFEINAMFVSEAKRAFDRVDKDIEHFYAMRSHAVDNDPTGLLRRWTRDIGLPDRTVGRMENTLPDAVQSQDQVTMFDLVNHVTNQANDPTLRTRTNARRSLEQAGGLMIHDHDSRCPNCHSRLH